MYNIGFVVGSRVIHSEGGNHTETVDTADPHASDNVQELREKPKLAQEELEIVHARLAQQLKQEQLSAAGEAAALAEQLKQTAEAASLKGTEQRHRAEDAASQLDQLARENEELQRRVFETEETARTEVEATRTDETGARETAATRGGPETVRQGA